MKKHFKPTCENPKCKGWGIFKVTGSAHYEEGKLAIQKCDECGRFEGDEQAQAFAIRNSAKTLPARLMLYNSYGAVCTMRTYRTNPRLYGRLLPL